MSFIVHASSATDRNIVGGKAASLARLAQSGFAPPDFFSIRSDAFRQDGDDIITEQGLEEDLHQALKALGNGPFAVRSSGRAEDGAETSYAGQFTSILNTPETEVIDAAKKVWASGFGEGVQAYRDLNSDDKIEAPAIVVQRMINARAAGVAFSADPVSGLRQRVVISAISGLGDRLVSGEVDGEDWTVDWDGTFLNAPEGPDVLSKADASAVSELAREIETAFGSPQDIEWAFDGDQLHILQARPITTPLLPPANPDEALTIFDNSNIVESYPGLVSPLTYSFAVYSYARVYRAFVRLLGVSESVIADNAAVFENMLGRIDGRVYYNLVNWYRALALLPGFSLNRSFMETMMGLDEPLPKEVTAKIGPPPAKGIGKLGEFLRLVRVSFKLVWAAIWLPRTIKGFYARLNQSLNGKMDLDKAPLTNLAAEYRNIESQLLDRWDAPLVNDFLCMIAFGASRNLMKKWLGEDGLSFHNDLMIGQGDIVSAEPVQRIAKMGRMIAEAGISDAVRNDGLAAFADHPDIRLEVDSYLAKFGDRCTQELKLESIPLTEDPTTLLMAIAATADRPSKPTSHAEEPEWEKIFEGHAGRQRIARWTMDWTKARVRDRENLRFERTRIFGHARRVLLAMGRQLTAIDKLDAERDIFFLTINEILGAIEGFGLSQDLRSIVAVRKAEDLASAGRVDPDETIEIRGAAINVNFGQAEAEMPTFSEEQKGTGCSAGIVTAAARVIHDPRTESLTPGDILVARHTDPGWIAVFSNASAIVVERGSLLSHTAIVARELGIPCVVGLKGATRWIQNGETIGVDGARGVVRKVDD